MTGLAIVIAVVCAIVLAIAAGARRTMTAPDRYTAALGGERDALVTQLDSGVPQTAAIRKLAAVESADGYTFLFGGLARPEPPTVTTRCCSPARRRRTVCG